MLARELALTGHTDEADAACAALSAGPWRNECFFLLADEAQDPQRARTLCDQAGQYRNQCIGHAISRAISGIVRNDRPGEEPETMAALDAAIAPWIRGPGRSKRVETVMAQQLARRVGQDGFTTETCGQAPAVVCQAAYAERMRSDVRAAGRPDGDWRSVCPPPVTAMQAEAAGLPGWDEALEPVMAEGWARLCR
jgi:hypothetical protein